MDDISRALNEAVLKEMECPVCMEYMVPPIKLCTNGHNICWRCRGRVQCCPTCRAEFSGIRNVALENIARSQKYPCANRQNGCLDLFSIEHIAKHHNVCVYGKIKCPFAINKNCTWNGFKSELKGHAKEEHKEFFFERSVLRSVLFEDKIMNLLSDFGELFVQYKRIRDGRLYCAVQLIGTSSEASKYICEFTLRAANGIEQISKTLFVRGYSEDFETIFNSRKCLCLDEALVRHFLVGDKLNLDIKLHKVQLNV
jgi:E3 ubiquitin-protein ligase SIAH1